MKRYIKIDKANGEERIISKEEALRHLKGVYVYPEKMLEGSSRLAPLNTNFSFFLKEDDR